MEEGKCKNCGKPLKPATTLRKKLYPEYCSDCGPKGRRVWKMGKDGKPYYTVEKNEPK